jgi:hypothetical protein
MMGRRNLEIEHMPSLSVKPERTPASYDWLRKMAHCYSLPRLLGGTVTQWRE